MIYLISRLLSKAFMKRSLINQTKYALNDLTLWGLDVNERDNIAIDGVDAKELIKKYGSPLLAVNRKQLIKNADEMRNAVSTALPGSKVLYSYKTNCIPGILREVHSRDIGAEVISPYELWLAERLGNTGENIIYNGVNKTDESIERALRLNVFSINIDSTEEIERIYRIAKSMGVRAGVGIRLGFGTRSQFGLDFYSKEPMDACREINQRAKVLDLKCIHFNVTSNVKTSDVHKHHALQSLEFIRDLRRETGLSISYLDIGGGYGVPTSKNMSGIEYGLYRTFGYLPKPPLVEECCRIDLFFSDMVTAMTDRVKTLGIDMPKLIVEPGRFITSRAEVLLCTVLAVKRKYDGTTYVITDAGRLSTTFPCDFEYHQIFTVNRKQSGRQRYQVMGRICTSADWMYKNCYLPELKVGDVLAVMDAGAYFSSYSTNFAFPRPAIIMIADGESSVIRHEESFEHLIAMDEFQKAAR